MYAGTPSKSETRFTPEQSMTIHKSVQISVQSLYCPDLLITLVLTFIYNDLNEISKSHCTPE